MNPSKDRLSIILSAGMVGYVALTLLLGGHEGRTLVLLVLAFLVLLVVLGYRVRSFRKARQWTNAGGPEHKEVS